MDAAKISAPSSAGNDLLVFEVNGERFEVTRVDPSTTLLDFLRSSTRSKSLKLSCGEGGCGACVVLVSKYNAVLKQIESFTVPSCLTLLCSINSCSITTSDGLKNNKDDFHPIHERFSGFHASQCGFCTPGQCMSFFSALANAEKTSCTQAPSGFSKLTVSEAERAITGNLCRCTGYRPIADACKSFAADVDLEDLGMNAFWKKGDKREDKKNKLPDYDPKKHIFPFTESLKDDFKKTRILNFEKYSWYTPLTVDELQSCLQSGVVEKGAKIKLVVGNTGDGYFKETEKYDMYIDLRYIPELSMFKKDKQGIEIGAALPISKVILYLREESKSNLSSGGELVFSKLADHMEKVASIFVRNSGSIGGNLVMAQKKNFPSDIATLLLAVDPSVTILSGKTIKKLEFEEFLYGPAIGPDAVLLTVHIPYMEPTRGSAEDNSIVSFETYRAAPRPLGNALPYLNAAFLADICQTKSGYVVSRIRLAFGAYGTKHATRARKVEDYLSGKILTVRVMYEAVILVKDAIVPEEGTPHPDYRKSLAVSFLFSFLNNFTNGGSSLIGRLTEDMSSSMLEETTKSDNGTNSTPGRKPTLLSSGKQVMESSKGYYPVGEPIPKYGAKMQASGEAIYVDDIPSPPNCLHGALILSTDTAVARVKGISFKCDPQPNAVITVKDIPKGGENVGSMAFFGFQPLFPDDVTGFAGDIVGLVCADTQMHANLAAKMAVLDYETEGLDPPILTVQEAVKKSSFIDVPLDLRPTEVGDFSKGMAEADHKILSAEIKLGSQYCFYMETQAALAIPDEDNCIVVYSAIQDPDFLHRSIAKCLGIPNHNVRVITRRLGGAFGGKTMRAMTVATACALAAYKLRRPVRCYLDRKTDMIIAGGRHPMEITYSVGFKSNGKITALRVEILMNAGITTDFSPYMPGDLVAALEKYNWGSLSFDIKICRTNLAGKIIMRAPGDLQGSFIADAVLEHVASALSMEVDSVKNVNFHTYESLKLFYPQTAGDLVEYTLPTIWDKIAKSSGYLEKVATVEQFNSSNIWSKRGISRVPVVYPVSLTYTPAKVSILWDGSIVVEAGGIEMGQGLWTKVKQAAAYALGLIQCDGAGDLFDKVRIIQTDTLSITQVGISSGSTKSETSCAAVMLCCNALVERLTPLKKELQNKLGSVTWNDLIDKAHDRSINLTANSLFVPKSSTASYLNYGAAVSEVEVNILSGETRILQTDIIYDCGQSLNPAVDMGQIEGSFVQGIGFFMTEEYLTNEEGLITSDSTWSYHIPTLDNIPKQFNVEVLNTGHHKNRILSSKASGEPPLLLAASVHCAARAAITEARRQLRSWGATEGTSPTFVLDVPATLPVVKKLCGLDTVEIYLKSLLDENRASLLSSDWEFL